MGHEGLTEAPTIAIFILSILVLTVGFVLSDFFEKERAHIRGGAILFAIAGGTSILLRIFYPGFNRITLAASGVLVLSCFVGFFFGRYWEQGAALEQASRRRVRLYILGAFLGVGISGLFLGKYASSIDVPPRQNIEAFGKDKFVVDKKDLLMLREIAQTAQNNKDHDAVVKLMTWVIQFQPDEESFFHLRAHAYRSLGEYRMEIEDRKVVLRLNPGFEKNHLPIIEDYILLKEYDNAQRWIRENKGSISDHDSRIMFDFFDLVCEILRREEYSSQMVAFKKAISDYPLSKDFAERFWRWHVLLDFVDRTAPPQAKILIKQLVDTLKQTAR